MDEFTLALTIAGDLIDAGIPVFAAPPCPSGPFGEIDGKGDRVAHCSRPGHSAAHAIEYDLPAKWQFTVPSRVWLERWRPGWGLAAVGGSVADFLDEDPRNGGDASVGQLMHEGAWPLTFGEAETKSGGRHYVIPPLRERKAVGFLPGLDYQGGMPTDGKGGGGQGRGFIWIAPTVGRSKIDGQMHPYRWTSVPDLAALAAAREAGRGDAEGIRERIVAARRKRDEGTAERVRRDVVSGGGTRQFTLEQAREFCDIGIKRVQAAEIGRIEEETNAAACMLSRFVPHFWSAEQAYDVLLAALGETAYDPEHPASTWTAEKFHDVLSGQQGRAPGDWVAVRVAETPDEAAELVTPDDVDALIAEMIEPDEIIKRRPARHVVRGLLTFDSESWLIGPPGSKKSFVALDVAMHVAAGQDWQGRKVSKARVVIIAAEGAGGIGKRIDAWRRHYGYEIEPGWLRVLPRPVQARDAGAWAVLVKACERLEAGFIVIDTQARVTVGLEENSATDIGVYLDAARALRVATGACVWTVHHTGRRGGDARGSSAIDGAQDTELKIVPDGREFATLYTEKQKDIEPAEPIKIKFASVDLGQDDEGEPINSLVLLAHDAWAASEVDGDTLDGVALDETDAAPTPFDLRPEPQAWTHLRTNPKAVTDRWILQAVYDTAEDLGLSQAEIRGIVEEKLGHKVEKKQWARAFQRVTGTASGWSDVIVKVHGAQRWTVDKTAVAELEVPSD